MAIGNSMVAMSQKDSETSATDQNQMPDLELSINSLIRLRTCEDDRSYEPCTHPGTDSHCSQGLECAVGVHEGEAEQRLAGSQKQWSWSSTVRNTSNMSQLSMPLPCDDAASDAAQHGQTDCQAEQSLRCSKGGSGSTVGTQDDNCPKLLDKPQHAACPASSSSNNVHRSLTESDMVPSTRLLAAAPHYAKTVLSQEHEGLGSHPQKPMPFSHLLCLWAIKLVLPHPVTQKVLKLSIPDPPVFESVRVAEARLVKPQIHR